MHIPMLVYVLVTAHLIGDWWLQSNDMALGKSKNTSAGLWALTRHVTMVSFTLFMALSLYHFVTGLLTIKQVLAYAAVNAVAHWVTDFATSRFNAANWYVEPRLHSEPPVGAYLDFDPAKRFWFWRGIGSDQWVHYVTMFATAEWLLR